MDKNIPPRLPRPPRPDRPTGPLNRPKNSGAEGEGTEVVKAKVQVTITHIVLVFLIAFVSLTVAWYYMSQGSSEDTGGQGAAVNTSEVQRDELPVVPSPGTYESYDPSKLALADQGKVVIFFHASWCPSCQAIDADIKANLNRIPSDVHILMLDYDSDEDLRKKYEIKVQHTMVQVDSSGTLIKKWTGGTTLASVVERLQ